MDSRVLALLLALVILAAPALGGVSSAPTVERVNWSYTDTIQWRGWAPAAPVCQSWDNSSGSVCTSWLNASAWTCQQRTYLFTPTSLIFSLLSRAASGFAENFSIGGLWSLASAGQKALNGLSAFNGNFCLNGGNATAQDITNMQAELLSINLTELKGKKQQYVPVATDQQFTATGNTSPNGAKPGREAQFKFGNHSVVVTFTSTSDFTPGTKWNVTEASGSVSLTQTVGTTYGFEYMAGFNSSVFRLCPSSPSAGCNLGSSEDGNDDNNGTGVWTTTATGEDLMVTVNDNNNQEGDGALYHNGADVYANRSVTANTRTNTTIWMRASGSGAQNFSLWETTTPLVRIQMDIDATSVRVNSGCGDTTVAGFSGESYFGFRIFVYANNTYNLDWANNGTRLATGLSLCNNMVGGVNRLSTNCPSCSSGNHGWDNLTHWVTASTYARNGSWASTVQDAGIAGARWINWTNTSTIAANTGMSWEMRTSNTSFTQNASTPEYTPLGNASSGVNALTNISRYAQFRASLWSNSDTATPSLDLFAVNYTASPENLAAFTGNVTYAAPTQPVRVSIRYRDAEGGQARLALNNSSTEAFFCNNLTPQLGNGTASCVYTWNHTTDNNAPTICGVLTDEDVAGNATNCSAPITTDNAVPNVTVSSISNTSSASFTLNIATNDTASGVNRTWFSIFNLSNRSAGDQPLNNWSNTTFWANDTITLCAACGGNIRVAGSVDDSVGSSPSDGFRHWGGYSNASFYFDPVPTLTNFSVTAGSGYQNPVTAWVNVSEPITAVSEVTLRIASPAGAYTEVDMTLNAGTRNDGAWTVTTTLSDNFTTEFGTYNFQAAANDTTTTDQGTTSNVTASYGSEGVSVSAATIAGQTGGGGPAMSVYATPPPGAAPLANATAGLLCPQDIRQVFSLKPQDAVVSSWAYNCRTVTGFQATGCSLRGERVVSGGNLTGEPDPWWSCAVTGPDAVQIKYSVPVSAVPDSEIFLLVKTLGWDTAAKVTVESGSNRTVFDVRLRVVNLAAPLWLPWPVSEFVGLFRPMALPSLALAVVFAAAGSVLVLARNWLGGFWLLAAPLIFLYGLGSYQAPGLPLPWAAYGLVGLGSWAGKRWLTEARFMELQAALRGG